MFRRFSIAVLASGFGCGVTLERAPASADDPDAQVFPERIYASASSITTSAAPAVIGFTKVTFELEGGGIRQSWTAGVGGDGRFAISFQNAVPAPAPGDRWTARFDAETLEPVGCTFASQAPTLVRRLDELGCVIAP